MKKILSLCIFVAFLLSQLFFSKNCLAYWIWTPEIGKWINPKYAVKSSPKEQFDWAYELYEEKEYSKAAAEFDKLVFNYPNSTYAPTSLYYRGLCLEEVDYLYEAYLSYDRVLREYPTFKNIKEIIEREFRIGEKFLEGQRRKLLGVKILPSTEYAVEIFTSIADNAPFSEYGAKAQFNVGASLKKAKRYSEAKEAFEKVILNYPDSAMVENAKYEAANCSFLASRNPEYEQSTTREAIEEFSQILSEEEVEDKEIAKKAEERLIILQEKDAEHLYNIAKFYEKMKRLDAAAIYYKEVLDNYPETSFAKAAREKLKILEAKRK